MTNIHPEAAPAPDPQSPSDDPAVLWSARVLMGSLLDADGTIIGPLTDIVVSPALAGQSPTLRGFTVRVDRREIFVHEARLDAVDRDGVHLRGGTVDLRHFKRRGGEILVKADIVGTATPHGPAVDVGFIENPLHDGSWIIDAVAVGGSRLRRRPPTVHPWSMIAPTFVPDTVTGDLARLSSMHKADAASALRSLSDDRRAELAAALDASRLADMLEELPEAEQVAIIRGLDRDDAVAVLEEMEFDDATDLLKEMSAADREILLAELDDDDQAQLRSLLSYREDTAGGMMTPQAVIVSPDISVAEAIARLRDTEVPPALQVRLFISDKPTAPPTGRYLGSITLPRLLKEPPTSPVADCIDTTMPTVAPSTPENEVARLLARYDLIAVAVVDNAHRLVGVVTIDDVLVRLVGPVRR
jgi:CBS domain-containing protein